MVLSARISYGYINIILILIILVFSILLGGNFFAPSEPKVTPIVSTSSCCETGDGNACQLIEPTITYGGRIYKLLKRDFRLTEGSGHLVFSGVVINGQKVFINNSQNNDESARCNQIAGEEDLIFGNPCTPIPDDSMIYLCTNGCDGDIGQGVFDAYFQFDPPVPIPDSIKNCTVPNNPLTVNSGRDVIVFPSPQPSSEQNLQLRYFKIVQGTAPWLSPWCKPAIYLYPEEETEVNVKIETDYILMTTLPKYSVSGWNVKAHPSGQLEYGGMNLDYLYYESRIPDGVIEKPGNGYVVEYERLNNLLKEVLPKLGLNAKEMTQFRDYWTKVLPKSRYYFVGVISSEDIEKMSQLNIVPKPDSILRIVLYFEPLDVLINVDPPKLDSIERTGFTVVEWGGIFKAREGEKFSCLM